MSESSHNEKAVARKAGELSPEQRDEMMTVIVSEITMRPVAEQYPMTVAISEMASYYGVNDDKESVLRAIRADCNRQFRPTKTGSLMLADPVPDNWDGDMGSLPKPSWADDEDELERIAGAVPMRSRMLELPAPPPEDLFG